MSTRVPLEVVADFLETRPISSLFSSWVKNNSQAFVFLLVPGSGQTAINKTGWTWGNKHFPWKDSKKRIKLKQPIYLDKRFHDLSRPHFKCGLVRETFPKNETFQTWHPQNMKPSNKMKPSKQNETFQKLKPSKHWPQSGVWRITKFVWNPDLLFKKHTGYSFRRRFPMESIPKSTGQESHRKIQLTAFNLEKQLGEAWKTVGNWRIIPVSKWLGSPLFTSHLGHL